MGIRIYVGNLSYETTRETLEAACAAIGAVGEVAMPLDRDSGRPRGFAFVTMKNDADARAVIEQLDGSKLDGRPLRVNEAKERAPRRGRDF